MTNSKNDTQSILRNRRKELGYTMKEVANKVGVSEGTISRWESGDIANMRRDRIAKLAEALQVSPALIMGWDNSSSPVYDVAAGSGRYGDGSPSDTAWLHLKADESLADVHGRSMEPTLQDGDRVVIQATNVVESEEDIALVKVNGHDATLKHVKKEKDGIWLIAENPLVFRPKFYTADEVVDLPITIDGIVIRIIRDV